MQLFISTAQFSISLWVPLSLKIRKMSKEEIQIPQLALEARGLPVPSLTHPCYEAGKTCPHPGSSQARILAEEKGLWKEP